MLDLLEIRNQIDAIDSQMVQLFEDRMKLCSQVAEFKILNGKEVLDRKREEEKLEALGKLTQDPFNQIGVQELFRQVMAMSRKRQYRLLNEHGKTEEVPFRKVNSLPMQRAKLSFRVWRAHTVLPRCTAFSGRLSKALTSKDGVMRWRHSKTGTRIMQSFR